MTGSAFTLNDTVGLVITSALSQKNYSTLTDRAVTPGTVYNHPSACKAWCSYTSVTSASIYASYRITSVSRVSAGRVTLTFTDTFSSSTSYGFATSCGKSLSAGDYTLKMSIPAAVVQTTTTINATSSNSTGPTATDSTYNTVIIYGTLA